jgi:hypothetical protein
MAQARTEETQRRARDGRAFMAGSTEARPGVLTTEMWMTWVGAIVLVVAAYVSDTFDNDLGWILAASLFGAYILSRGFAKSGSREGPFFVSGPEGRS